jgi:hypothetical protein
MLAHVCRRWRDLVFQSPRRLDLQISYIEKQFEGEKTEKHVREKLDIWPAFPLIIWVDHCFPGMKTVFATCEHRTRICRIDVDNIYSYPLVETLVPLMQVPFPELTHLELTGSPDDLAVIPDSFLGGFAPHLRRLYLNSIPFPTLPKLLSSATHLVPCP